MLTLLRNSVYYGYLIVFGIIFFTMNNQQRIISNLISLSFIYVFMFYMRLYMKRKISNYYNSLIFVSVLLVFINVSLSGLGGFDYYKKAIMYSATIIWLVCCVHIKISRKEALNILYIGSLSCVLYFTSYLKGYSIFASQGLLYLNFSNPNLAGMFILNSLLYLLLLIFSGRILYRSKIRYIFSLCFSLPLFLLVGPLLYFTGCRSAILSLLCFFCFVICDYFMNGAKVLRRCILMGISIFPFVFALLYVAFIDNLQVNVSMGLDEEAKSSGSRVIIWEPILSKFDDFVLYGDYFGISNGSGMSQMHNTHIDIFASYGILPLILFVFLLYKILVRMRNSAIVRFQRFALYAFISCMFINTFEAGFVSGSGGLFLFTCGFLILSNTKIYENSTN